MPQLLSTRLREDTIFEFERAAEQRRIDAMRLALAGRSLAAIYLQGYSVEISVKAAYFRTIGHPRTRPIAIQDRNTAVLEWNRLGLRNKPGQHDLLGWAELLAAKRQDLQRPYPSNFQTEMLTQAKALYLRWRETIRYHTNVPYGDEIRIVSMAAHWFAQNYPNL